MGRAACVNLQLVPVEPMLLGIKIHIRRYGTSTKVTNFCSRMNACLDHLQPHLPQPSSSAPSKLHHSLSPPPPPYYHAEVDALKTTTALWSRFPQVKQLLVVLFVVGLLLYLYVDSPTLSSSPVKAFPTKCAKIAVFRS